MTHTLSRAGYPCAYETVPDQHANRPPSHSERRPTGPSVRSEPAARALRSAPRHSGGCPPSTLIAAVAAVAALSLPLAAGPRAQEAAAAEQGSSEEGALPEIEVTSPADEQKLTKYPKIKTAKKPAGSPAPASAKPQVAGSSESVADGEAAGPAADPGVARVGTIAGTPGDLAKIPGSANVVTGEDLYGSHVFTTNEALRKVPGVNVRDEEGLGIRPNIGIRGLNPTRSTKTLLLEDGLFLTYAPYGDNASYFHPSMDRFESVEVLKGAEQILYGPQTISGTVNYVTPNPPLEPAGFTALTGGSRDYFNGQVFYGGWSGPFGGLVDYVHKEGDGARDNTHHEIEDAGVKGIYQISPGTAIIAKASYFREDSQVSYSGITDAEMRNFGIRYNPFDNDEFNTERLGASLAHRWAITKSLNVTSSIYWNSFDRDWWRQASTTTDGQCGFTADRLAGVAIDPDACQQRQGRLRSFETIGFEQRWELTTRINEDVSNRLRAGFRVHAEDQNRLQINSFSPFNKPGFGQAIAGSGNATAAMPVKLVEHNERAADAVSYFIQNRLEIGAFNITPAIRFEDIEYTRRNLLETAVCEDGSPAPCRGTSSVSEAIPGISVGLGIAKGLDLFAGVHEGFAPPRAEDSIANNGGTIEVGAEKSTNIEAGFKSELTPGFQLDATYFHNDFDNLVAAGSVAGGNQPLAQGEALFEGLELLARLDSAKLLRTSFNLYGQVAWTYLWTAEQSTAFTPVLVPPAAVAPTPLDTAGNRQPYAPEHLVTARIGYAQPGLFDVNLEMVYVGEQYADFLNLETGADHPSGAASTNALSGQFGKIESYTIFNLGATYTLQDYDTDIFFSVKNLFDDEYIVDRTRGILPGAPRLVHFGLKKSF